MAASTRHRSRSRKVDSEQNSQAGVALHKEPGHDIVEYFAEYAREKPEIVALWCLGIGFMLGWKLKPW